MERQRSPDLILADIISVSHVVTMELNINEVPSSPDHELLPLSCIRHRRQRE